MALTYQISKSYIGNLHSIDINQEEFEAIKLTRTNLLRAISTEDTFDIILENFIEFEEELLGKTLRQAIYPSYEWSLSISAISLINRKGYQPAYSLPIIH